jgi:hypothetical protein
MNTLRLLWPAVVLAGAWCAGCAAEVERKAVDGGAGGSSAEASGEDTTESSVGGGGAGAEDPRFALCPPAPSRPGDPSAPVPSGVPDETEAAAIFQRASHEVGHVVSAIVAEEVGDVHSLFDIEGEVLAGNLDGQTVRGIIARDEASGRTCVALVFDAWTGGHGGWGFNALDGTMELLIDAESVDARGLLGLVESGPLEGAPAAPVTVRYLGEALSGTVGAYTF